ncbi:MAG: exodeoxyribonuclease V subunit alpha [Spirochaetes bacterium]|nr:exodeoxyribonuclease V subunit alpha [Spirochaetota bacterium]
MVNERTFQRLLDLSVVSGSDTDDLKSAYKAAVENLDLLTVDYQTIRDLARLSGYSDISLHLLLIAMFASLADGSVCLNCSPRSLERVLAPVCGAATRGRVRDILHRIRNYPALVHCRDESAPALFEDPRETYKPLILAASGDGLFLYFQKYYAAEKAARDSLRAILSRHAKIPADPGTLASVVRTVFHEKPLARGDEPVLLNGDQQLGVVLPALKNFVLISGGPGTGKTFIVLSLLRVMARLGVPAGRIRIAAPTGRAARKMTESILKGIASIRERDSHDDSLLALQGATLHRLLRYSPARDDYLYNRFNPLPADLIIIDEASMIDIVLLGKLFEAVSEGSAVVMLGDRNQLPSVDAGAVLTDLIPGDRDGSLSTAMAETVGTILPDIAISRKPQAGGASIQAGSDPFTDRVVILNESYRSEEAIKNIAGGINRQDRSVITMIPEWDPRGELPLRGVWRIEPGRTGDPPLREMHRILSSWAARHYLSPVIDGTSYRDLIEKISSRDLDENTEVMAPDIRKILGRLDEARILTPLRSGIFGAAGINRYLLEKLGPIFDPAGAMALFNGAPIIITQNDYERGLFNGDVGLILKGSGGRRNGAFSWPDGIKLFPAETLPPHEPSFCITVHKSQGSEYGNVLLVLPEGMPERLLTREILYTALTRAKQCAIIYATRPVLERAMENRIERESRIRLG